MFRFKENVHKDKKTSISTYALGGYNFKVIDDKVYDVSLSTKSSGTFSYNSLNSPALLGDLNGDGNISVADARKLVVEIAQGDRVDLSVGDFNGDGKISVADARKLVVAIAKG